MVRAGERGNCGGAVGENGKLVECVPIRAEDLPDCWRSHRSRKLILTVVGPDNPLALGIVDLFQKHGLRIWGPNQKAAQFESSKVFLAEIHGETRDSHGPGGDVQRCGRGEKIRDKPRWRLRGKGGRARVGKRGVDLPYIEEAGRAIDEILTGKTFGSAGSSIVIQEFLEGTEISLHALCDGRTAKLFPTAQDHKRALDGDQGLNTGGMGTYSPTPFLNEAQLADTGRKILEPWLKGCAAEGIDFRGILYPGVMLTKDGPKVLEFNARFGDPETQVYLTRLENDLVELLDASVDGTLDKVELKWSPMA